MSENHDATTGQFVSSEPLFGEAAGNAALGYTTREDSVEMGPEDTKELADNIAELRGHAEPEVAPGILELETVGKQDPDAPPEALSQRQLSEEIADRRFLHELHVERRGNEEITAWVDNLRANVDPTNEIGQRQEAKPKAAEPAQHTAADVAEAEAAGLDVEVHRALKQPQVRAAIEQEFSKAETVRGEYTQALQNAHTFGLAAIHAVAPELSQVPAEQMEHALQVLAQVAPDRYQAVAVTLQNVAALQQHQQQAEQHRQAVEQQQITTWAKGEDARLETMGVKFTPENVADVVSYAGDLGLTRETLANAMLAHPILRSAEVQRMMADAAAYAKLQKGKPVATRTIPHVQRPGISVSSAERQSAPSRETARARANIDSGRGGAKDLGALIGSLRRA